MTRATLLALGLVGVGAFVWLVAGLPTDPEVFRTVRPDRPFLDAMLGFTDDQWRRHLLRLLVLGPALLLVSAGVAHRVVRVPERLALGAGALSLTGMAVLAGVVLRGRALVDDELSYRMQALLYAGGRLGDRTIPPWQQGVEQFTIITRAGFTGKYLPGEPLVQLWGALVGVPALAHVPVAALTLWAFHRSLAGFSQATRSVATALLALSPTFVFTGATGLSHTSSLACVTLAALGLTLVREGQARRGALVAGVALGFGLLVRVQAVAPFGGVLGLWTLALLLRARRWDAVGLLVGSGGLGVVAILAYDAALTGDPLRLPWYLFRPLERFGFGEVFGEGPSWVHTPWRAVVNLGVTAVRFNGWWLGWPLGLGLLARAGPPSAGGPRATRPPARRVGRTPGVQPVLLLHGCVRHRSRLLLRAPAAGLPGRRRHDRPRGGAVALAAPGGGRAPRARDLELLAGTRLADRSAGRRHPRPTGAGPGAASGARDADRVAAPARGVPGVGGHLPGA